MKSGLPKKNGQIPEWPKGTDCKSAGNAFEGSNPSLPIKKRRNSAGQSSLEARRAHNPEVAGSNPVPAIFYAQLAQLVEQRTENPRVSGSIPEPGILSEKTEWGISSVGRALDF